MEVRHVLLAVLAAGGLGALAQGETYGELVRRFYSTPEMRERLSGSDPYAYLKVSATGRFNGTDPDRLTIFPVEESLTETEYGFKAYGQMLVKSEKGTVPDLIIDKEPEEYCLGFGFGDIQCDDMGISTLSEVFEPGGPTRDGLLVRVHPEGSTIGKDYTYLCRDGKWNITPPVTPYFMNFRQCAATWPEAYNTLRVTGTWCKNMEGRKQTTEIALFPESSGKYLIKMNTSGKDDPGEMVDNESGTVEGTPVGVSTYPDWWSHGEQLLLVEMEGKNGPSAKLYRFTWEVPDASYMNGELTYDGSEWNEVGYATRDTSDPSGWRVTRTDADRLENLIPWWQ